MKAAVIRQNGDLDVINIEDLPEPRPGAGEVLLEMRAAGLNHLDIWVRKGRPGATIQAPHVLGSDGAGIVLETGAGVRNVRPGDEVIVYPALSCGICEYCRRGERSECGSFGIIGLSRSGTFAERIVMPAENVQIKPAHMTFPEAAGLTVAYLTAWRMLMTRAKLGAGEVALIHGIGGGVALAALQLAKLHGVEVIVTSSSDDKLSKAKKLGADHLVNYRSEDVVEAVGRITSGRGVDVAVDTVGAATWPLDLKIVRRAGRVVICGVTTGAEAPTDLRAVYWNQLTLMGSTLGSTEELRRLLRAAATTKLKPVMDSTYPLDKVKEATARMEKGDQFGKIVLTISPAQS